MMALRDACQVPVEPNLRAKLVSRACISLE